MTFLEFRIEFNRLLSFAREMVKKENNFAPMAVICSREKAGLKLGLMSLTRHPQDQWPQAMAYAVKHQRAEAVIYGMDAYVTVVHSLEEAYSSPKPSLRRDRREQIVIRGRHFEYGKWLLTQPYTRDAQQKPIFHDQIWKQLIGANDVLDDLPLVTPGEF